MHAGGRKKDNVWQFFEKDSRGSYCCTACRHRIGENPKVENLRNHQRNCSRLEDMVAACEKAKHSEAVSCHSSAQSSISSWIQNKSYENAKGRFAEIWLRVCLATGLSYRDLSSDTFLEALRDTVVLQASVHPIRWNEIQRTLKSTCDDIEKEIRGHVEGKFVCLIVDGWSKKGPAPQIHAHGVLFCDWNGETFFHKLFADNYTHDAEYLTTELSREMEEIERIYNVRVTGIVADNAFVMDKTLKMIKAKRPILSHHCSAHWLQLLMKDISKTPEVTAAVELSQRIRRCFFQRDNFLALQQVCRAGSIASHRFEQPCATRWNSVLDSMISVLKVEDQVLYLLSSGRVQCSLLNDISKNDFRMIGAVCTVFLPIAEATDKLQRNDAGPLTEVTTLRALADSLLRLSTDAQGPRHVTELSKVAIERLRERNWKENWVENEILQNVASFLCMKRSMLDPVKAGLATEFLVCQGPCFLQKYDDYSKDMTLEEIREALRCQLAKYVDADVGSQSPFEIQETVQRWQLALVGEFHLIAKLARMVFAVRSSEAAAERAFSYSARRVENFRSQLDTNTLSKEMFIRINTQKLFGTGTRTRSKRRKIPFSSRHNADAANGAELPLAEVDTVEIPQQDHETEVSGPEPRISTLCIPYEPLEQEIGEDGPIESIDLAQCTFCSILHDSLEADDETAWWRCRNCWRLFCADCADHELNDLTGLCTECSDPEVSAMEATRKRRKNRE